MTYTVTTPDRQPPAPALAAALHELATRAWQQLHPNLEAVRPPQDEGTSAHDCATHGSQNNPKHTKRGKR